ncbi:hypothetical protein D3C74_464060 [compost metagenome]
MSSRSNEYRYLAGNFRGDFLQKLILIRVMQVKGRTVNLGTAGDIINSHAVKPFFGD